MKNRQPAKNGDAVSNGDVIQTGANQTATVVLDRGGEVFIRKMTRVRIYDSPNQPMEFAVVFGGIDLKGLDSRNPSEWPTGWAGNGTGGAAGEESGDSGAGPLPYLAAFGFGNFSFPSIGGGSTTSSVVTSRVNPTTGQVEFLNDLGQVVQIK